MAVPAALVHMAQSMVLLLVGSVGSRQPTPQGTKPVAMLSLPFGPMQTVGVEPPPPPPMCRQFASQVAVFGGSHCSPGSKIPLLQTGATQAEVLRLQSALQPNTPLANPCVTHVCPRKLLVPGGLVPGSHSSVPPTAPSLQATGPDVLQPVKLHVAVQLNSPSVYPNVAHM